MEPTTDFDAKSADGWKEAIFIHYRIDTGIGLIHFKFFRAVEFSKSRSSIRLAIRDSTGVFMRKKEGGQNQTEKLRLASRLPKSITGATTYPQNDSNNMQVMRRIVSVTLLLACVTQYVSGDDFSKGLEKPPGTVRIATYNISHHRKRSGELAKDLIGGRNRQSRQVAQVLQLVRPDILLLNEFDYDPERIAAKRFLSRYLEIGQGGHPPLNYRYTYSAPVNTGVDSGHDLNNDGTTGGAADCFGYGQYPGQYGMLVLSKYPIRYDRIRTYRKFLWKDMPNAMIPTTPNTTEAYYDSRELNVFRLSSKSHWDIPIQINDTTVHFLTAHPTPPVFDSVEDRNGKRNHDEIRLFADYIDPARSAYIYDDVGHHGGLHDGAKFVIGGDFNADPFDGDSTDSAILQLLEHPLINAAMVPQSSGGREQSEMQGGVNEKHQGPPQYDTADFGDQGRASGNLRIDYVLPSKNLAVKNSGVFWPRSDREEYQLINASDHRLVWIDVVMTD